MWYLEFKCIYPENKFNLNYSNKKISNIFFLLLAEETSLLRYSC